MCRALEWFAAQTATTTSVPTWAAQYVLFFWGGLASGSPQALGQGGGELEVDLSPRMVGQPVPHEAVLRPQLLPNLDPQASQGADQFHLKILP